MNNLPNDLSEAIAHAYDATEAAIADGYTRVQIELVIPEIELESQSLAQSFISRMGDTAQNLKVLFPDTGAAALARRDWGELPGYKVDDIGTSRSPVASRIEETDERFLLIAPSAIEVAQVEKLCNLAGDRPVILLIPQLEDVSIVGIGYAARQLRERFISTLTTSYYFRPLEGLTIYRTYPGAWQIFSTQTGEPAILQELSQKPTGEALEKIMNELFEQTATEATENSPEASKPLPKKPGFLGELQKLMRALTS
jgi:hypothetical protein